ncbi:carbamoyltransferase N-terminal domain-containing protein [uncultured Tateyamaria sp.]|uniref:carbamoyltransferase family protein n=3 Tax=uncultured Tateyamaria sp. TaxID=455651 RepID=UPI002617FF3D|nr:carbamoyltransferase N-terminal domain-containing protein [uncultured Tateyamaria sp.]
MSGKYVLGVSSHFHDAAAVLVQGDRIIAAAQEERFTRQKADWRFPENAIAYCLSRLPAGAHPDAVAYYEDPALKAERIVQNARHQMPGGARLWPQMVKTLGALSQELPAQLTAITGHADDVHFVAHHRSHAASAFYPSPFASAAVLVVDGVGEYSTTTLWSGTAEGLEPIGEIRFPHSLGLLYSAFTQYCGFRVNSGEYKLMGLAPFGAPIYVDRIKEMITLRADGSFALDMSYFDFARGPSSISPLFEGVMGKPPLAPDAPVTPFYMNIAASVQAVLEEAMIALARHALATTGHSNLCLAGGVALNCVANGRLRAELPELSGLWIQPAAGDAGGALGAALEVARDGAARTVPVGGDAMDHALLGPSYDAETIRLALEDAGLVYDRVDDPATYAQQVAKLLAKGRIVGHFDGAMEFGPRALGNRSILADARGQDTLNHVNRSIKFREGWRPFAPIVLADEAATYFETTDPSPYMLLVARLRAAYRGPTDRAAARAQGLSEPMDMQAAVRSDFDAVTHVDFSARLQTMTPGQGSRAADILAAFHARTGCPMLLNTSFNVRGEPIVCTPQDAITCFMNTRMQVLAIGPFIVQRGAQGDWIKRKVGKVQFDAD